MKRKVADIIIGIGSLAAVGGVFNLASGMSHGFNTERNIETTRTAETAVSKQNDGMALSREEVAALRDYEKNRNKAIAGTAVAILGLGAVTVGLAKKPV